MVVLKYACLSGFGAVWITLHRTLPHWALFIAPSRAGRVWLWRANGLYYRSCLVCGLTSVICASSIRSLQGHCRLS